MKKNIHNFHHSIFTQHGPFHQSACLRAMDNGLSGNHTTWPSHVEHRGTQHTPVRYISECLQASDKLLHKRVGIGKLSHTGGRDADAVRPGRHGRERRTLCWLHTSRAWGLLARILTNSPVMESVFSGTLRNKIRSVMYSSCIILHIQVRFLFGIVSFRDRAICRTRPRSNCRLPRVTAFKFTGGDSIAMRWSALGR